MLYAIQCFYFIDSKLTTERALIVVSSREAAKQPSSGDPPSHIPAKAAIERAARKYITKSASTVIPGLQHISSQSSQRTGVPIWSSGSFAYKMITQEINASMLQAL